MPLLKPSSEKVHITVNLESTCGYQITFLKSVNQQPLLYNPDFLKKSLYRYEVLWLPLAAKHHPQILVAPLDIEWIWHCHMLSPIAYAEDCTTLVGKLINHALFSEQTRQNYFQKGKDAWQKMYPNQPFEILPGPNEEFKSDFESKISYDIIAAALRQKVFFYQVSLPHFTDGRFLKQALSRYKKYLLLKKKNPGAFLVPCYDIDLIWHSHQLHPANYANDTTKLFQRVFNHDDSVNDRSPNSKLSLSDADTRLLWKNTYNENFALPGAMYRGNPPDGKLYKLTRENLFRVCFKKSKFVVKKVQIVNIPADMTKYHLAMKLIQKKEPVAVKKLKGPSQEWEGKALLESEISTASNCLLELSLHNKVGVACCGDMINFGKRNFNLQSEIHFSTEGQTFCKDFTFDNAQTLVQVTGHFTPPILSGCKFKVNTQHYTKCTMPLHIEQMWGPVPLPQQAPETENSCNVAEHL